MPYNIQKYNKGELMKTLITKFEIEQMLTKEYHKRPDLQAKLTLNGFLKQAACMLKEPIPTNEDVGKKETK
jgi:hypothetical protein